MRSIAAAYLITIPLAIGLDAAWIGYLMKGFYASRLAAYMGSDINWLAGGAVYIALTLGIFYFASFPASRKHSLMNAAVNGALLGLFAYSIYDLTNLATFPEWRMDFVLVDTAWGTFLSSITAAAGYGLLSVLPKKAK